MGIETEILQGLFRWKRFVLYLNSVDGKYKILKRIGNLPMIRKSFDDYDINEFKSKSLDWWATFFIKKKLYPLAHIICKKVLYK